MPEYSSPSVAEVVGFTSDLIAIDTTNTGGHGTMGEGPAAHYIADQLRQAGGDPQLFEPATDRTSVIIRFPGIDRAMQRDTAARKEAADNGIVVHGHLDVVPADATEWSVDPFGGLIRDGQVWGRGAIDMKGADAVMLTVARRWLLTGARPRRDVVFAWLADEEAGGSLGAQWLCRNRPEVFAGCGVAIGEVGGFSIPVGRPSLYPIMTAERAHARLELTTRGAAGHGSVATADNAIAALARTVTALVAHRFPAISGPSTTEFLRVLGRLWGVDLLKLPVDDAVRTLGPLGELIAPSLRHSLVPTMISGGYASNVVPSNAGATFDCRILPGEVAAFTRDIAEILGPEVETVLTVLTPGMEVPFEGDIAAAIGASLRRFDPAAVPLPYMVSASTDAAHFAALGMLTYGFSPLQLPAGFRYGAMFHGRDEHVPIQGLTFGVEVLDDFLRTA